MALAAPNFNLRGATGIWALVVFLDNSILEDMPLAEGTMPSIGVIHSRSIPGWRQVEDLPRVAVMHITNAVLHLGFQ